jgi:acetylornithine deacetylase/succinyl-diaminopimelate desuccinylase-like protein
VLLSHIDVVAAGESQWRYPPFSGREKEGRLWGRGALDTKHLTAMEVYALTALAAVREKLDRDVWLAACIDEEKGSVYGAAHLAEAEPELFIPGAVVISEGGGFPVTMGGRPYVTVTAGEKGLARVEISAAGPGGHPGLAGDDQAAPKLCAALESLLGNMGGFNRSMAAAETQRRMVEALGGTVPVAEDGTAFDLYNYAGEHSAATREIKVGGTGDAIPASARITVEFKVLPGLTRPALEKYIQDCLKDADVKWNILDFEPGFENPKSSLDAFSSLAQGHCRDQGFDCGVMPMLALGRTDGRFFGPRGCEVYGFSPLLMDDNFQHTLKGVHGSDESIGADSFRFGCRVMKSLCLDLAGAGQQEVS